MLYEVITNLEFAAHITRFCRAPNEEVKPGGGLPDSDNIPVEAGASFRIFMAGVLPPEER